MAKKKSGKMFESKFDESKLREMITAGKNADEIQQSLDIASKQSLRQHVLKLINIDRQFYDVPGLYSRNQSTPMINFKGEMRMTKRMLGPGKFQHNDRFSIEEITNAKIVLCRIGAETEEEAEPDPEVKVQSE